MAMLLLEHYVADLTIFPFSEGKKIGHPIKEGT